MEFKIREAKFKDLDGIHNVEVKSFKDAWSKSLFKASLNDKNTKICVVEDKGIIAFMMYSKLFEVSLDNIAVLPEYRRFKIGESLLKKLLEEQKDFEITLEVEHDNEAAKNLYTKFGFIVEGLREDYYGKGRHAYIMWKRK